MNVVRICRNAGFSLLLLLSGMRASSQLYITGPTCVVAGNTYYYTIAGTWNNYTSMNWNANGGYFVGSMSGTPLPQVQITWATSGSVTLRTYSPSGSVTLYVSVSSALQPGTVTPASQTINYGGTAGAINALMPPSGGSCTPNYGYQWQQSLNNYDFTNIPGATGASYSPGTLYNTTYFQRQVTDNSSGMSGVSNVATVVVNPPIFGGTLSPNSQQIFTGGTPGVIGGTQAMGGGCTSFRYQWQVSADGYSFTNISATSETYQPPANFGLFYYRRVANSTCDAQYGYSTVATVNVQDHLAAGTVSPANATISPGTSPGVITSTTPTGGFCSSYSNQWEQSSDGAHWTLVSGATGTSFTPGNLNYDTYFQMLTSCGSEAVTSPTSIVNVSVVPGTIMPLQQQLGLGQAPQALTVAGALGGNGVYTYQWLSSSDGTNWSNIGGTYGTSYTPAAQGITMYYRVVVNSNGSMANSMSSTVAVNVSADLSVTATTPSGTGSTNTLSCTPHGGNGNYSYAWFISTDGGASFQPIAGVNGTTYYTGVVNNSTAYYVQVSSGGSSANSNTVSISLPVAPTISANTTTLCNGAAATLTATGSSGNYTWYNGAGVAVGTGSILITAVGGSYYATSMNGYGVSPASNPITLSASNSPSTPIVGNTVCVVGSTLQLTNATAGGAWSSGNPGVASIDGSGLVTGVAQGTAMIAYTVGNSCGTSVLQLGITVSPLSTYSAGLGRGIPDPVITDTIALVAGSQKTTQFQQDTSYSAAHSIQNVVALRVVEESPVFIPGDFSATAMIKIEYGHSPSSIYQVDSTPLSVSYTRNGGNKYNAINYITFNNAEFTRLTVLWVAAPQTVGGVAFDTRGVLQLTNSLMATRYYVLADGRAPVVNYSTPAAAGVPDELPVSWSFPAHTNNNYTQLEWAWLPNGLGGDYAPLGVFDTTLLFKRNATRIDLPGGAAAGGYGIPLLYGDTGVLFIRARAVNLMPSGSRSEGPWSAVLAYPFTGHNPNLNWQVSTSFAEEGKRKSVIQYFDGSLRSRQTVTKDNSTGTTVTAETFYDAQGRPAIQVLPAPGRQNTIGYTPAFNQFAGQAQGESPLNYFDFSTGASGAVGTAPLSNTSGAGQYYSTANPDTNAAPYMRNIPSTAGYAYAVTRYTPDGTGRIWMQSGIGDSLKMGSGHITTYFYGNPAQEELDGLFGTEAGDNTHYFKNMVQDANGQMSVSYVDMHGRTVATALTGAAPSGVQSLPIADTTRYVNQGGTVMTRDLLGKNNNNWKGYSRESVSALLVPIPEMYNFIYTLALPAITLPACNGSTVSYPCTYAFEFSVSSEAADTPFYRFRLPAVSAKTQGQANYQFNQSLLLPVGSYTVRKSLIVNVDSMAAFMANYGSPGIGLCPVLQQLTDSVAAADSVASGCGAPTRVLSCSSCKAAVGSYTAYLNRYARGIGLSSASQLSAAQVADVRSQYISDSSFCQSINGSASHSLDNIRLMMLSDMTPYSGQYAGSSGSSTMYSKYNIFSTGGNTSLPQPFFRHPLNAALTPDVYHTPTGAPDTAVAASRLAGMAAADFENAFQASWAAALLPYHPEYMKWQYAVNNLSATYNFIDSVNQTGVTAFGVLDRDPYFTSVSTGVDAATMRRYSDTAWQSGYSMWQQAYGDAAGCKLLTDTAASKNCFSAMPASYAPVGTALNGGASPSITAALQAAAWGEYRAYYSLARTDMVNRWINGQTDSSDNAALLAQGFQLYFPTGSVQAASASGLTTAISRAVSGGLPGTDSAKAYADHCSGYVPMWQKALLQCPALAARDSASQALILHSITGKLLQVCQLGTDGANPYGSSTVSPANAGAPFASFEQAVNAVLDSLGIPRDQQCNPYGLSYPKPYGTNATVTKQSIAMIDTCQCSQFARLKQQAATAGYSPSSLSGINQYLRKTYRDTLTAVLYQGLQQCGQVWVSNCRTVSGVDSSCLKIVNAIQQAYIKGTWTYAISPVTAFPALPGPVSFSTTSSPDAPSNTYQWMMATDGSGWTPIPGVTGSAYNGWFSVRTYIKVVVHDGGNTYESNVSVVVPGGCNLAGVRCDTAYSIPLPSVQPMPLFLTCGFTGTASSCFGCSQFVHLDSAFAGIFGVHPSFAAISTLSDSAIAWNNLFARYVNFETGLEHNWTYYADQFSKAGCPVGGIARTRGALSICLSATALTDTTGMLPVVKPCQTVRSQAGQKALLLYAGLRKQTLSGFQSAYLAQLLSPTEAMTVTDSVREYHYTLYYYDQAGNLVKTVPPAGVRPDFSAAWTGRVAAARANGTILVPGHTLVTRYCYNSLNQVNIQKTPDGGVRKYWYDRLGRLLFSQSALQAGHGNVYSYTQYDSLNRITEAGQVAAPQVMTDTVARRDASLRAWLGWAAGGRSQMTRTVYDTAYPAINGVVLSQQNLRSRVSYVQVINRASDSYPASATYYSYDVHGNVDTLVQDFGNSSGVMNAMNASGNRFKRVQYEYDLISGKVNRVVYEPGYTDAVSGQWVRPWDQYYQQYAYDAENRVTDVYSGRDSVLLYLFPQREVHYSYYKHGPLARADVGQLRVQGLDYVYTLQGWLKGINPVMGGTLANGRDTSEAFPVAQDAFGVSLHYYAGDYAAIGYPGAAGTVPGILGSRGASLYNGNIAAMGVDIPQLGATRLYNYHYDQLNRLVAMDTYNGLNGAGGTFTPIAVGDYQERAAFDANGNIRSYIRHGDASRLSMDSLSYAYQPGTNRLVQVADAAPDVAAATYPKYNDIKKGQGAANYGYDADGNLVTDAASGIRAINWSVYGKMLSVTESSGSIYFSYDGTGNRISKSAPGDTTFYVRDASGNVLSIYEKRPQGVLVQTQIPIYGSGRLGMATQHSAPDSMLLLKGGFATATKSIFGRGEKLFELTNHLGNVLATVTDRRVQKSAGGQTVDSYLADVAGATDYYPFGMVMPGRNFNSGGYRYGFNGKEKDDEVKGVGNSVDYGMRVYDPRVGRFLSTDPLSPKYPMLTPYQFASNRPIDGVDEDGLEYMSTNDANISSAEKNKDNSYTLKIGEQTVHSPGTVSYNGNSYYNLGQNLYKTDQGISSTGTASQKITTFFVTEDQMKSIFSGAKASIITGVTNSLNANMGDYGIDTYKKLAQFLGQAGEETWGLTNFSEDLNRSLTNLCSHCKEGSEISNNAGAYTNNPINYGNLVYANKIGNGDVSSGNGYNFRGRGLLQLTGKGNYQSFNHFFNKKYGAGPDFLANADLIATNMNYATISGLWFFSDRVGSKLDLNNASVLGVTKRVNGGTNGLSKRKSYYNKAVKSLFTQ